MLRRRLWTLLLAGVGLCAASRVGAGEFRLAPPEPSLDRWMYPFNFAPGGRVVAPTYGSFDPRFDTRDAQFLLGWNTASLLATNAGPARYLLRRVQVTLTSVAPPPASGILPFLYDPTYDRYVSYFRTNEPGYEPDADPGRPIELYGAGFRGGFTEESFLENSYFGPLGPIAGDEVSIETRNAYAAVHDLHGGLIDIANQVGQLNVRWTNAPFEVRPWAVGMTADAPPGAEVPDGARVIFEVDLQDPLVAGHLQRGLDEGRLRLVVSSLSPAGQSTPGGTGPGGMGAYPWWATRENPVYDAPKLVVEGTVVGDEDADQDGLPDDWERFWLGNLASTATDDPDQDGATNEVEHRAGTNPGDPASRLALLAIRRSEVGEVLLRFTIAPSRTYRVEMSHDLAGWTEAPGVLTYPDRGVAEWLGSAEVAPEAPAVFFRVQANEVPSSPP